MNSKTDIELECLRLNLNSFTKFNIVIKESFPSFLEIFQTNTNLKKLKITANLLINKHVQQMITFLELLKNNKSLKSLRMILVVRSSLDNNFCEKLLETLEYNKTLKRLWLYIYSRNQQAISLILELMELKRPSLILCMQSDFTITDLPIFQKLKEIKYLRKLILGIPNKTPFIDNLFESLKYIEKLELNIADEDDSMILGLSEVLEQTNILRTLKLSLFVHTDSIISILSNALKNNRTIEELSINFRYILLNIDFEGLLKQNTKLKKLFLNTQDNYEDMEYNNFNTLIELFRGLKYNKTLKEISCPVVFPQQFKELREALEVNNTLRKLTIKKSIIYSEEFFETEQILLLNKGLTHLTIEVYGLCNCNVLLLNNLFQLLKENKNLTHFKIFLPSFYIESSIVNSVKDVIRENKTLKAFSITLDNINDSDVVSLLNTLAENKTLKKFKLYSRTAEVNEKIAYAIVNLLNTNKNLRDLKLFVRDKPKETKISKTLVKTIKDSLRVNKNISRFFIDIPCETLQEMDFITIKNQEKIKHCEINISEFESISDVTLYFNTNILRLHKVILSQSEVFKDMFQKDPNRKEFQIYETDERTFLEMIKYLYGSEVKKSEELSEMLKKYNIPEKQLDLSAMFNNVLFSDISFKLKDHIIHLHKIVLCSQSEYMKAMLLGGFLESQKSQIEINEDHTDSFMVLLESFYKDQVEKDENLLELLILSDKYLFFELKRYLQVLLDDKLQIKNVCKVLDVSDTYNAPILKKSCLRYISQNLSRVRQTRGYKELKERIEKLLDEENMMKNK
jgi:hypothetical protein